MSSVEKSALVRAQEAELAALEQRIKKVRRTIKSLKTRLANTQQKIEKIQQEMFNTATRLEERMRQLVEKIRTISQKIEQEKRLDAALRREIKSLIDLLWQGLGLEDQDTLEEQLRQQAEAREKAQSHDTFAAFQVLPDQEENKDIRKLYLQLSKQFHPDKARTTADKKHYQALQQQIIQAYERGDYETLMDLQRMHQSVETLEYDSSQEANDLLAHKIAVCEQQLLHLGRQQERLSQEIKALRKSELGQMLTDVDSMARAGFSLADSLGITDQEKAFDSLEQYYEALVDSDRLGYLSPKFEEIFAAAPVLNDYDDHDMGFIMDALGLEDDDLFDLFGGPEDEVTYNPDPTFKENSVVELTGDYRLFFLDQIGQEYQQEADGLSGTVEGAFLDEETGQPIYTVRLDSRSLRKLEPAYCQYQYEEEDPIDLLFDVPEVHLKKRTQKRREKYTRQLETVRQIELGFQFEELPEQQLDLLTQILTIDLEEPDYVNWLTYLSKYFPLPLEVKATQSTQYWKVNQSAQLRGVIGFNPYDGLIAIVEIAKEEYEVPLSFFTGEKGSRLTDILDIYRIWLERESFE